MHTLDDVLPLARRIRHGLIDRLDFQCEGGPFGDLLAAHPNLVLAISHATPLSWLPIPFVLSLEACAAGQGQRVPFGVVDRFFFRFPPLRPVGRFLTQAERAQDFNGLLERLQGGQPGHDLVIFPEGNHTFFADTQGIGPFRSPRFVELAVRAGVPLLLVVHRGTERWSRAVPVPAAVLGRLFKGGHTGRLNVPLPLRRIHRLQVKVALYTPSLRAQALSGDRAADRPLIEAEAQRVRARMQALLASLDP
ncbi:MAG: hypothetical protein KC613_10725 [Myxococcales bacterium]|nr:hypothetical protein [Myxococcales bacterium]MCB9526632.1 hypothetical protein [Myxococcales bacterium]